MKLKPVHDQVIVITGASSGIGLATARLAARRGAEVMLASRNEAALARICDDINRGGGGRAAYAVADVGREKDVERLGRAAVERFGRIDTWFNCAGAFIFGRLFEIPVEEHRRLFDTNYWGVVNGSRVAIEHLRDDGGGALINMGSGLADRAIPIQSAYCASKFAVKGFTEALRMEIEQEGWPISVTHVKPSSIDTPYYRTHAKNYMPTAPKNPPPVYDPAVVAEAVLHCASHPKRDVYVGAGARLLGPLGNLLPRLTDRVMELVMPRLQTTGEPAGPREHHALFRPTEDGDERGDHPNYVSRTSLYTHASLHPLKTGLAVAGMALAASALLAAGRRASE